MFLYTCANLVFLSPVIDIIQGYEFSSHSPVGFSLKPTLSGLQGSYKAHFLLTLARWKLSPKRKGSSWKCKVDFGPSPQTFLDDIIYIASHLFLVFFFPFLSHSIQQDEQPVHPGPSSCYLYIFLPELLLIPFTSSFLELYGSYITRSRIVNVMTSHLCRCLAVHHWRWGRANAISLICKYCHKECQKPPLPKEGEQELAIWIWNYEVWDS